MFALLLGTSWNMFLSIFISGDLINLNVETYFLLSFLRCFRYLKFRKFISLEVSVNEGWLTHELLFFVMV